VLPRLKPPALDRDIAQKYAIEIWFSDPARSVPE